MGLQLPTVSTGEFTGFQPSTVSVHPSTKHRPTFTSWQHWICPWWVLKREPHVASIQMMWKPHDKPWDMSPGVVIVDGAIGLGLEDVVDKAWAER